MNEKVERLQALTQEQRELITKLATENQRLQTLIQNLNDRIQELEGQRVVIDREMAEIPVGFGLISQDDLSKY